MIYIAHRGASGDYPENTLLAFSKALDRGATWLELDVHLSKDGELVVIHDETLERTTNGKGPVNSCLLRDLRQLDAGHGQQVPLLSEVLELISKETVVNIELKGVETAAPTARLLGELLGLGRLTEANLLVSSLEFRELEVFRSLHPGIKLAAVLDRLPRNLWSLVESLDLWSVHVSFSLVSAGLLGEARQRGVRLFVFTVNHEKDLQELQQLGVDGVFTDYPGRWQGIV